MNFSSPIPHGVLTAAITPLHDDLSVNFVELIDHCQWLLRNGSDGLALLGTTGEANSFSVQERLQVLQAVADGGLPLDKIMVGTGSCAFPDTIELTQKALDLGYGGILLLPPFYYKGVSDEGIYAFIKKIIDTLNDARLKIFLYHIPQITGVPFSHELTQQLAHDFPGTVVGMKDSSGDFNNMKTICEKIPGFQLYAGTEKYLLDVLEAGGVGCISATANATVQMAEKVYAAYTKGENAKPLQDALTAARVCFEGFNFVSALKSIFVQWHEGDTSWLNMRPPNVPLKEEELAELNRRLNAIGFEVQ